MDEKTMDVGSPCEAMWDLVCESFNRRDVDLAEHSRRRRELEERGEIGYVPALIFAFAANGDREKAKRYFAEAVKERLKERGECEER